MKKGELEQSLGALRYMMNKQGVERITVEAMIRNERKLEKAISDLSVETRLEPNEAATQYDEALKTHFESLSRKHQKDFDDYSRQVKKGQLPVPPQHIDKWGKLIEKARQDFPEGAKFIDEYQERMAKVMDEDANVELEMINIDGLSANEVKSIWFMIHGFSEI